MSSRVSRSLASRRGPKYGNVMEAEETSMNIPEEVSGSSKMSSIPQKEGNNKSTNLGSQTLQQQWTFEAHGLLHSTTQKVEMKPMTEEQQRVEDCDPPVSQTRSIWNIFLVCLFAIGLSFFLLAHGSTIKLPGFLTSQLPPLQSFFPQTTPIESDMQLFHELSLRLDTLESSFSHMQVTVKDLLDESLEHTQSIITLSEANSEKVQKLQPLDTEKIEIIVQSAEKRALAAGVTASQFKVPRKTTHSTQLISDIANDIHAHRQDINAASTILQNFRSSSKNESGLLSSKNLRDKYVLTKTQELLEMIDPF